MAIKWEKLREPFSAKDIEWRVQQSGLTKTNRPYVMVLAYVTNRAIQQRLDDVVGPENWENEFAPAPDGGVMCGIAIHTESGKRVKWDGASNTDFEAVKGGLSNSMKRAAVQWGIGRYLYELDATFADASADKGAGYDQYLRIKEDKKVVWQGYWRIPNLPSWALPEGEKNEAGKTDAGRTKNEHAASQHANTGQFGTHPPSEKQMQTVKGMLVQLGVDKEKRDEIVERVTTFQKASRLISELKEKVANKRANKEA